MRVIDTVILAVGVFSAIAWVVFSGKDGFKSPDTMILARSISISSTIDGQVRNTPPPVGARVRADDMLVHIQNGRLDRSRLVELESQIKFFKSEIANGTEQQKALVTLYKKFEKRAATYKAWMLKDVQLRKIVNLRQLEIAKMNKGLKSASKKNAAKLYKSKQTSVVSLNIAKTEEEISKRAVKITTAELQRSTLFLNSLQSEGMFFENGDTSYWLKMADSLKLRYYDSRNKLALLKAELARTIQQHEAETIRVGASYTEDHVAPFTGVVNATFVSKGTPVTSGTNLLQILDCDNPVVIVPIPEHRISEFSVGMKATVYPIDSEEALSGTVRYISSGPLIGIDKTIQIPEALTLNGNRAIVSFDDAGKKIRSATSSCETSRRAVAVIHTNSMFSSPTQWTSTFQRGSKSDKSIVNKQIFGPSQTSYSN